jgi:hypothetical protein
MARRTRNRKHSSHKKSRRHLRQRKYKGGVNAFEEYAYSTQGGDMQFYEPAIIAMSYSNKKGGAANCNTVGQPNNRNNLPYYPYVANGSLNSGFQQGELSSPSTPLFSQGELSSPLTPFKGGKRRKTMKRKSKRGGGCGGQSRESWFRGAYPVLLV